jgi:hypothetical protein
MKAKKLILTLALAVLVLGVCNYAQCTQNAVRNDFREKLLVDTLYLEKTDTVPVIQKETVTRYIKVPVPRQDDCGGIDTCAADSVQLAVVQRTYSDDSTYTAYVSGVAVDSFPRLDSIKVTQRIIIKEHEIERTITKKRPITYGLQIGGGYGIVTKQPDIYIGIGLHWNW